MLYIIIILSIVLVFALTRLLALKNETKKLKNQLQIYNNGKTNKKIDMALLDKTLENLGLEINRLIDKYVTEHRKRIHFEKQQRQAIANMSHDLRTPLTSIIGYIQMAKSAHISEEEKKELLTIAYERAQRLQTLLNDFFELSIIESTDHPLNLERINVRNVTTDVLMSFYDRFLEKNMEPEFHISDVDLYILADESALIRVIENLLSNAITHSDGNIIIHLKEENGEVKLIVKNDAHSLTEEDVNHIFDRFYIADKSRTGKSTGLGLSIVKSFMEKMNGEIISKLEEGQLSIICTWESISRK